MLPDWTVANRRKYGTAVPDPTGRAGGGGDFGAKSEKKVQIIVRKGLNRLPNVPMKRLSGDPCDPLQEKPEK